MKRMDFQCGNEHCVQKLVYRDLKLINIRSCVVEYSLRRFECVKICFFILWWELDESKKYSYVVDLN